MDMDKCCVVVFSTEKDCTPDKMTPQAMHALVRARETYVRYRAHMGVLVAQFFVVSFFVVFTSASPASLVLGVLGASMVSAVLCGIIARFWRKRFEKLASG